MENEYMSAVEAAGKWGVTIRQVQRLLKEGRVAESKKIGNNWLIPRFVSKPDDLRKKKSEGNIPSPYLSCIYLSSYFPMSKDDAQSVLKTLTDKDICAQYASELMSLKGDFETAKRNCALVGEDSPVYICACAEMMSLSVGSADYASFVAAKEKLENLMLKDKNPNTHLLVQTALSTIQVSMFNETSLPDWITKGDFSVFPPELRAWAIYIYTKYLQTTKQYSLQLGCSMAALTLCEKKDTFTILDIYFRLQCASACFGLDDTNGVEKWLYEALELALPHGFIAPFKETIMTFGGILEKCLFNKWPEFYKTIAEASDDTWRNWVYFHDIYAKDNIVSILTKQEWRLAIFLGRGISYSQAAQRMGLSIGRIKNLASSIYSKLYIKSRKELKRFGL